MTTTDGDDETLAANTERYHGDEETELGATIEELV